MDAPLTCIKDLGDRWHTDSREPYFYEAGYTHDHLPQCTYTSGIPSIEEPVHDHWQQAYMQRALLLWLALEYF